MNAFGDHLSLSASAHLPSSPLRMDCDDEVESVGWVQRTGEVSLDEADINTEMSDTYNAVLSAYLVRRSC